MLFLKVFEIMRKQEQTRLADLAAEKAHYEAVQSQAAIVSDCCLILRIGQFLLLCSNDQLMR